MTDNSAGRHHRHLIELASLLATAGLTDMFADEFGTQSHGAGVLVGLGATLVIGIVVHHLWITRAGHAPPNSALFPREAGHTESVGVLWRLRAEIDDTPGRLAVLAGALSAAGADIRTLHVLHPTHSGIVDEFLLETAPTVTPEALCAAVRAVGGRQVHAAPADLLALVDAPAHALSLAARLARGPNHLPAVLADLLGADQVEQARDGAGVGGFADPRADRIAWADRIDGTALMLHGRDGGHLVATRAGLPFTTTELSRARAMADLSHAFRSDPARTGRSRPTDPQAGRPWHDYDAAGDPTTTSSAAFLGGDEV